MTSKTSSANFTYATRTERVVAALADASLISAVTMGLIYFAAMQIGFTPDAETLARWFEFFVMVYLPWALFAFFYDALFLSRFGSTPAKKIMGLVVTDKKSQLLSFNLAMFRERIGKVVSSLPLWLGLWQANKNRDHQAWHDEFVGSVVVRQEDGIGLGGGVLIVIVCVAVQGWIVYQVVNQLLAQLQLG